MQQNAFDPVDEATPQERQLYVFGFIYRILEARLSLRNKEEALGYFQRLRQLVNGWNSSAWQSDEFKGIEREISALLEEKMEKGRADA